jgi:hypothetical protein
VRLPLLIVSSLLALFGTARSSPAPRGACVPTPPPGVVGSICGFANPEDVEAIPAAGILLVSNMRPPGAVNGGFLAALLLDTATQTGTVPRHLWPTGHAPDDVGVGPGHPPAGDPECVAPPAPDIFAPHGITSAPTETAGVIRVAAVGHGGRQAIELFDLSGSGQSARLTWRGCVPLPRETCGNDVSLAPDGEIIVSNYMPTMQGLRGLYYTLKGGLGYNTGDVMGWRRGAGWRHINGTAAPSPNGVLISRDGAYVFYSETGSGRVSRVPRAGLAAGQRPESVSIGGNPDNLSLSPRGMILATTHTDGAAFLACAFGRLPCRTGWSIFEIDPTTLRAKQLLHHDGSAVGAVASVAEIDGRFYFGAVFDDRIGVWQRPH